ncbi:MAG: hypothetical protein Terrestrivirus4_28 [Terrestrivirus sp.]|uniref:Uncharacterized protein n=1 Tax=Terrestrivirus sp. TaxID=2487775 RepID=A0A3G4ZM97_9VIRU|nr:MAG: hypothetical protein Terrestrivirus4_28 [Terrestrivirus sp.]
MQFIESKGNICLVGKFINEIALHDIDVVPELYQQKQRDRDNNLFHLTFLLSSQIDKSNIINILNELNTNKQLVDITNILHVGLGNISSLCYYQVIYFPLGNKWLVENGFSKKDFHITVGFKDHDIHDKSKGLLTTVEHTIKKQNILNFTKKINSIDDINIFLSIMNGDTELLSQKTELLFNEKKYNETIQEINTVLSIDPNNLKCHIRLLQCYKKQLFFLQNEENVDDVYKKMELNEDILLCVNNILDNKNYKLTSEQINFLHTEKIKVIIKITAIIGPENKTELKIPNGKIKLPNYTSWIIPGYLGGCGLPKYPDQIKLFELYNISLIITLREEELNKNLFKDTSVKNNHFVINDHQAPTLKQIIEIVNLIEENLSMGTGVMIHCLGGKGRTGTLLACYIAKNGLSRFPAINPPCMYPAETIKLLRSLRPISIETNVQENSLKEYITYLSNISMTQTETIKSNSKGELIMLIGLPGSGKSTFSEYLKDKYYIISQDEIGSRSKCEELMGKMIKQNSIILDRCNVEADDRHTWFKLAFEPKSCIAIFFDIDPTICKKRVTNRVNHKTIEYGSKSAGNIIDGFYKKLQPPSINENFFSEIHTVRTSMEAYNLLKNRFQVTISNINTGNDVIEDIIKFPRTQHLLNLGSMTSDDIIINDKIKHYFVNTYVTVQEKIDGSNMGISYDPETCQFVVQNRSKVITSGYHAQYSRLDNYLNNHYNDLYNLLSDGKYILYGEWMQSTHTIYYDQVPDYFVAYDLFDKQMNQFKSFDQFRAILKDTDIQIIPVIYEGITNKIDDYKKFLNNNSSFSSTEKIEGVYVRIDSDVSNIYRAKIVGEGFRQNLHERDDTVWNGSQLNKIIK